MIRSLLTPIQRLKQPTTDNKRGVAARYGLFVANPDSGVRVRLLVDSLYRLVRYNFQRCSACDVCFVG